ncbi:glycosyltransferase [Pseudooceanicola batsensis]|uniref:glycosyltransferase n=1 Tax=Pseudooceanicola batsensis TaxID=314255 RepID=UPI000681AB93|nr:glycosyltransferase family 2 protein [Pseudooceanicola batsensis]
MDMDVVIPAHSAARTLPACIDGVVAAGFAPHAIIVADDRSRDETAQIARQRGARVVQSAGPGAAAARNSGVSAGQASVILFVDADVVLHAGGRERIERFFETHPDHAALIGSYDDAPPAPGALSRIRNLLHHHTHQRAGGDVTSFWGGIGAIRRADFVAGGGFPPGHLLEDVALGVTLARAGRRVRLDPDLQGAHLKRWTLRSMARADLIYRALPWSRMLLDPEAKDAATVLSANRDGKVSVVLSGGAGLGVIMLPLMPMAGGAIALAGLAALAMQNRGFLCLVRRRLGGKAALQAPLVLWVHFCCAGAGYAIAWLERLMQIPKVRALSPRSRHPSD